MYLHVNQEKLDHPSLFLTFLQLIYLLLALLFSFSVLLCDHGICKTIDSAFTNPSQFANDSDTLHVPRDHHHCRRTSGATTAA
jgi:hypothetical protein